MKAKTYWLGVFLFLSSSVHAAVYTDYFYDGLDLAIQHFNSDHRRPLKWNDPEQRWMAGALYAISQAVPGVSEIHNWDESSSLDFKNPFLQLGYENYVKPSNAPQVDTLTTLAESLVSGCPYEKTTSQKEINLGFGPATLQQKDYATYKLSPQGPNRTCANQTLIQLLVQYGITEIKINSEDTFIGVRKQIVFQSTTQQDLEYVRAELTQTPELKDLTSVLRPWKEILIGVSKSIRLETASTGSQPSLNDPVKLTYTRSWGDCPAGCTMHHRWLIQATPLGKKDAKTQLDLFKVKVLNESGDLLSN